MVHVFWIGATAIVSFTLGAVLALWAVTAARHDDERS